jgi:predicted MFS family arabinose efflux permease
MLGASVATSWGLRAPFILAAGIFALAAMMVWVLVPKPQQKASPTSSD